MRYPSRKAQRRRMLGLAIGLLVLITVLGWWSARARKAGTRSPADQLLLSILSLTVLPAGSARNHFAAAPAGGDDPLTAVGAARLLELEEENRQLRALLSVRQTLQGTPLAAQVIGRSVTPWQGYLLAAAGKDEEVQPHMVAVASAGVVGQVVSVAAHTADILPLTDTASGIGAKVVRTHTAQAVLSDTAPLPAPAPPTQRTVAIGVLKGYQQGLCPPGLCYLAYISDQADVKPGDRVVTSGLGLVFGHLSPAGFPLGTVASVKKNTTLSSLDIIVTPAADPKVVQWVLLVK